jgi:hypothetical protein
MVIHLCQHPILPIWRPVMDVWCPLCCCGEESPEVKRPSWFPGGLTCLDQHHVHEILGNLVDPSRSPQLCASLRAGGAPSSSLWPGSSCPPPEQSVPRYLMRLVETCWTLEPLDRMAVLWNDLHLARIELTYLGVVDWLPHLKDCLSFYLLVDIPWGDWTAITPQRSCVLFEGITWSGTSLSVGFQVLLGQHLKTFVELDMERRTDMSNVPSFNQCHISVMYWSLPCIDAVLISWSPLVIWTSWLKDLLKEIDMT